mmetsp:Transcript_81906/g.179975  ORF Transcript_81906/g.179975 Transcript_81906/m.179975 type:complete len:105 (-) Transcript_81906:32-346(-)
MHLPHITQNIVRSWGVAGVPSMPLRAASSAFGENSKTQKTNNKKKEQKMKGRESSKTDGQREEEHRGGGHARFGSGIPRACSSIFEVQCWQSLKAVFPNRALCL